MAVSWVVAPCSLVTHRPDDGGSKVLRNVGKLLPDYTALQLRRQPKLQLASEYHFVCLFGRPVTVRYHKIVIASCVVKKMTSLSIVCFDFSSQNLP
jgi:hypothetical protein